MILLWVEGGGGGRGMHLPIIHNLVGQFLVVATATTTIIVTYTAAEKEL